MSPSGAPAGIAEQIISDRPSRAMAFNTAISAKVGAAAKRRPVAMSGITRILERKNAMACSVISALAVFVAAAPPHALLVAALRRAIEPLIGAPQTVEAAGVGRIGVVDDTILQDEGAHARPIAHEGRAIGARAGRDLRHHRRHVAVPERRAGAVVVFGAALALLLLGDRDLEVEVEVATRRRRPREGPAHPRLVGLQLREWRT